MSSTRAIVTEAHIAGLLRETLGERIKTRAAALQEMVRKLDAGEQTEAGAEADPESSHGATRLAMSTTSDAPVAAPKRRGALVAFALGLMATAAGAAWLKLPNHEPPAIAVKQAPATSAAASVVPPDVSPPSIRQVLITLRASPELARISVDGSPPRKPPLVLQVPSDGQAHQVVASASGYHDKVTSVTFDADHTVELVLEPVSRPSRTNAPHVAAERAPVPPRPKVVPPPKETAPPHVPGEMPATVEKSPRPLDANNPFAQAK
jgi:hypothetical protein